MTTLLLKNWRLSAALKIEVAEHNSGVLRLTLSTAVDQWQ